MNNNWHWLLPLALIISPQTGADIVTDGSLGGVAQSLPKPQGEYAITESLGKVQGSNLFHSFSKFDVATGETANFQASNAIFNILTRVTGGAASQIDGTLRSNSTANLWLINPAGWVFGKDAKIDVNGALHITTANALGFKDGGQFLTDPAGKSSLSFADPIDYQFTQARQGNITIDATSNIVLEPGKNFVAVGGDLSFRNSHIVAPGGRILLGSNAGTGVWREENFNLVQREGTQQGTISISDTQAPALSRPSLTVSELPASDQAGGATTNAGVIQLTAQNVNLKNAMLSALAMDDGKGGSIKINGANIHLDDSNLTTQARDAQNAGNIMIRGNNLELTGTDRTGSQIRADTTLLSKGNSGVIDIALTNNLHLNNRSVISSTTFGQGNGGDITVTAKGINLDETAIIRVSTANSSGNAGNIKLHSDTLALDNNSSIISSTDSGRGDAGTITVASRAMSLNNASSITSASNPDSTGKAGSIALTNNGELADRSLILQHSRITTSTNIRNGDTTKRGDGGNINVDTGTLVMKGGFIQANTQTTGKGGLVNVTAQQALMSNNSVLKSDNLRYPFFVDSNADSASAPNGATTISINSGGQVIRTSVNNSNVIQAAAPNGLSGTVNLNTVELNIAGQLARVNANFADNRPIADDPCSIARGQEASSLVQMGQGGLPASARDALSLPLERHLSGSGQQLSAADAPMQLALYTPTHYCAKEQRP